MRQIGVIVVAVPDKSFLGEKSGSMRRRRRDGAEPSDRCAADSIGDNALTALNHFFFLGRFEIGQYEILRVGMAGDLMAAFLDRFSRVGKNFGGFGVQANSPANSSLFK